MALSEKIQALKKMVKERPGGILTIYLDTDRSKPEQQNGEWRIRLKNGLKKLEEYLYAQNAKEDQVLFKKTAKKVKKKIHSLQRELQKGLIVFVSHDFELMEFNVVQVPVENEFHWESKADTTQLESIHQKHPRTSIILAQAETVRMIDLALGQIVDEVRFDWLIETEEWREYKSSASLEPAKVSSSSTDPFEKRKEVHIKRQYKKLIPQIQQQANRKDWQKIYLVGENMYTEALQEDFKHIPAVHIISKNLNHVSSHNLLEKVI